MAAKLAVPHIEVIEICTVINSADMMRKLSIKTWFNVSLGIEKLPLGYEYMIEGQ